MTSRVGDTKKSAVALLCVDDLPDQIPQDVEGIQMTILGRNECFTPKSGVPRASIYVIICKLRHATTAAREGGSEIDE